MKRRPPRTTRLPYTTLFRSYDNQGRKAVVDTINKANGSCSVTGYTVTYNGSSHTATGACTGVGGVSDVLTGLDLTGTTHTAANTYNDSWTFTDVTGNYNNQGPRSEERRVGKESRARW